MTPYELGYPDGMSARTLALAVSSSFLLPSPAHAQVLLTQSFDAFLPCSDTCGRPCLLSEGWTNLGGDQMDWVVDSGGTTSRSTGPSTDHTLGTAAGRYLYTEASSGCSNRTAEVASPVLTFTSSSSPVLSFWYHMYGSAMGTLHVDVIRDPNGTPIRTNDVIPPLNDNLNQWQQVACVPLDPSVPAQIVFRGRTGASFTSDMAIDDVEVRNLPGVDVEVADFSLTTGCAGVPGGLSVTLVNNGGTVGAVPIEVSVDGNPAFTETVSTTLLACGAPQTVTLTNTLTLPAGPATVRVRAAVPMDAVAGNDELTRTVAVQPIVSSFPYLEGFESTAHGWVSGGANATWARGLPADAVISGAFNGSNAFVTGLSSDYADDEASFIEGPCYDFSGLTNPRFEARVWWESVFARDGAQVQVSTDGGATWDTVGTSFSPGWYNNGGLTAMQAAFGSSYGFTGRSDTNDGSGGWVRVGHDLDNGAAGASAVRVRVVFASDGSGTDEGFAIDDVRIVDNLPRIEVLDGGTASPIVAAQPGEADRLMLELDVSAVLGPNDVDGMVFTRLGAGADADLAGIEAWLDDGDDRFEPAQDTLLGGASFSSGRAQVSFTPRVAVARGQTRRVFVSGDFAATLPAGGTYGVSLAGPSDVLGPPRVALPDGTIDSPLHPALTPSATRPFEDGFEAVVLPSRGAQLRGPHPTATSTGAAVVTAPSAANAGRVRLASTVAGASGPITPRTGSGMFVLDFPSGPAVASLDYRFDLSSLDPSQDDVFFDVWWQDVGQADDPADHVFVSPDGGATWIASVYDFNPPSGGAWRPARADLSAAFRAAGRAFTSDVLVRVQVEGGPGQGALLLDDAWLGIPERIVMRRAGGGADVSSGQPVSLGLVPGGAVATASFDVVNVGRRDLTFERRFLVANATNVNGVSTSGSGPTTLPPGGTSRVNVFYTPIGTTFGFDVSFPASDPRLTSGRFVLPLRGAGMVEPEIELRRAGGAVVTSGEVEDLGAMRVGAAPVRRRFVIASLGTGVLDLTGSPPVSLEGPSNASARVLAQPEPRLPPGTERGFELEVGPAGPGPFSVDVVVESTDPDEGRTALTFVGEGAAPEVEISRGGAAIEGGAEDDVGTLTVGEVATFTYRISNLGSFPLRFVDLPRARVISVVNVLTSVEEIEVGQLEPGAFVDVEVGLEPRADGDFRADLTVLTDDADEAEYQVRIVGTGLTPQPDLRLSQGGRALAPGERIDAGAVPTGETQSLELVLENVGDRTLEISGQPSVDSPENVEVELASIASSTVAPGASVPLAVAFTPSADGAFGFRLRIFSNDPDPALFEVAVAGTASTMIPDLVVESPEGTARRSGALLRLEEVELDAAAIVSVVLRNVGTGPLTFGTPSAVEVEALDNARAEVANQPAQVLAAGEAVTVEVSVTPEALGAFSGRVVVNSDDPETPQLLLLLSGTGVPDRGLAMDEGGCTCVQSQTPSGGLWGVAGLALAFFGRRGRGIRTVRCRRRRNF